MTLMSFGIQWGFNMACEGCACPPHYYSDVRVPNSTDDGCNTSGVLTGDNVFCVGSMWIYQNPLNSDDFEVYIGGDMTCNGAKWVLITNPQLLLIKYAATGSQSIATSNPLPTTNYYALQYPTQQISINEGGAWDVLTSTFTAPRDGVYQFTSSFQIEDTDDWDETTIVGTRLKINGNLDIGVASLTAIAPLDPTTTKYEWVRATGTVYVQLEAGDTVQHVIGHHHPDNLVIRITDAAVNNWLTIEEKPHREV